jgi:transketolase
MNTPLTSTASEPELGLEAGEDQPLTDHLPETAPTYDGRQAFAEQLIALAREDQRIVAVCNDSVGSSNLNGFKKEFACAAAPFLTGRALEQIKADVAYSNVRVVLCGQSPGMAYGELGPTHHSIEDLSWLRAIANLPIVVPADPVQTSAAVRWAATASGPSYIRVPRFKVPEVTPADAPFEPGKAVRLTDGDDITIIAIGTMVSRALWAAQQLRADGIGARVLNMTFVEPLDREAVLAAARETRGIVTAEEATTTGGLGAAVAATVIEEHPVPMRLLGIHRQFAPTGDAAFLLEHFGLTSAGILGAARELLDHD